METWKRDSYATVVRASLGLAAFGVSCLLLAARPAAAAVVCVPNMACDGTCTASDPTIQGAIDLAIAGDTVLVCPGTYVETVTAGHGGVTPGDPGIDIDKSLTLKSTSGAAVTTIQANGGHCLPTSCPGGPQQAVTLSASGITIDGFTILETSAPLNLITADGDAVSDNHTIENNVITNPTFDDGNTGGGWGILLGGTGIDGADNNLITVNEISLNPDPTKNQFTFGIGLSGGGADSNDNNVISNNVLHDMGFGGFGDKNDTNTTVSGNTFMNLAKVGWQDFGSTSGEMILGNTFDNAGRAGLEIRNGAIAVTAQNNCFSLNGSSPPTFSPCPFGGCTVTPFGGIRIEDDAGATTGSMIHNNNFAGNNAPNGITDNSAASTNTDGQADNDWWGCAAGPGNAGCDNVTANVDFTPFLTSEASGTPCSPTTTTTTASTTTTSSTLLPTTTTVTVPATTTTTTTIPGNLNVTRARLHQESAPAAGNGSIRVQGDFNTPPPFSAPPPVTARVQDSGTLDQTHTFTTCATNGAGRIRCEDSVGSSSFRADFKPFKKSPSVFKFKLRFNRIVIDGPFTAPVKLTLTHNAGVVRMDTISDCRASNSGLNCREF